MPHKPSWKRSPVGKPKNSHYNAMRRDFGCRVALLLASHGCADGSKEEVTISHCYDDGVSCRSRTSECDMGIWGDRSLLIG